MRLKRIIIYPKDVQRITGKSERYGRQLIRNIKNTLHKEDHQCITITEFSNYMGLDSSDVEQFITD
ncbi:MAG: hypothetical protein ABJG78_12740 [Cyclobacteriaceae bacterium]